MPDDENTRRGKRTTIVVGWSDGARAVWGAPDMLDAAGGGSVSVSVSVAWPTDADSPGKAARATTAAAGAALDRSPTSTTELARPAPIASVVTNVRTGEGARPRPEVGSRRRSDDSRALGPLGTRRIVFVATSNASREGRSENGPAMP